MEREILGTVYTKVSDDFQRGLYPIARTIKAENHDLAVVMKEVEVNKLGNIYGFDGGNYAGNVYDSENISPTLRSHSGGNTEPMIIAETKCLNSKGGRGGVDGLQPSVQDRVHDTSGISTTITSSYMPSIIEKQIVAMRGRNPDNPSDRTAGSPTEQRLETNSQGVCNTFTSVQKDDMVLETVKIKQATKDGYIECNVGGVADLSYPESKTRRGRVQENGEVCPTLTATETGVCRIESLYRIRKLTPLEYWRLMDFSDEDFHKAEKANSNTQLYKQAGNSIVVSVLEAIFKQMLPDNFFTPDVQSTEQTAHE